MSKDNPRPSPTFKCESGHRLWEYYSNPSGTGAHQLLCPVCDREYIAVLPKPEAK